MNESIIFIMLILRSQTAIPPASIFQRYMQVQHKHLVGTVAYILQGIILWAEIAVWSRETEEKLVS